MKIGLVKVAVAMAGASMLLAISLGHAADTPKKELTPQQQRMSECSTKSKGMKGAEHQKFMSDCLKGGDAKPAPATQQEKMKSCNADASKKNLKGDERKAFMSSCLKG
jgi:hypothetical protein